MFKILGIILLLLLFFIFLVVMLFTSVILSFIRRFREMAGNKPHESDRHGRDYTGRRQQQYSYREHYSGTDRSYGGQRDESSRASAKQQNETVVDTRSSRHFDKKIFDDDEGEYVDFVEE